MINVLVLTFFDRYKNQTTLCDISQLTKKSIQSERSVKTLIYGKILKFSCFSLNFLIKYVVNQQLLHNFTQIIFIYSI